MTANDIDAPLILAVAPNGARKTQADHPAIPITPDEIAAEAARCREAGAAMIHLHVRDADNKHSLDADAYAAATAAIRREVGDGIVIQMTTEAVGIYAPAEQMAAVRAVRPEAASMAVRELCPDEDSVPAFAEFLAWMAGERIMAQYILYAPEDVALFTDLQTRGVIPGGRPFLLYVLGRYTPGQKSVPEDLLPFMVEADRLDADWAICAFGARESACALTAAALGGHVRVGFENNFLMADGSVASDNAALAGQVASGAKLLGRTLAGADEARAYLGRP
ncbi:MAG: 3-keto-5-aminohexanoate cleavage protein [Alphaproteobacteria bacterium]|nr:3-keto-5-aminohexanoate cleavage protein [Alphaproteobacteria bacterium]